MANEKIDKDHAKYEDHPATVGRRCGMCDMYRPPVACTLVKGHISAGGTCRYWEARKRG